MKQEQREKLSYEAMRDLGVTMWKAGVEENDIMKKKRGLRYLLDSYKAGDAEAAAWIGLLQYQGMITAGKGDSKDEALKILYSSAHQGSLTARIHLNKICADRYSEIMGEFQGAKQTHGPLVDFDGKRITINRTGRFVPVDAVLEYVDGMNRLTFSLNLEFGDEELADKEAFENAVISGIKEWEGEYRVFGDQPLQVVINVTRENRMIDNVLILAMTEKYASIFQLSADLIGNEQVKKNADNLLKKKRSMAVMGLFKWSVRSKKMIFIASQDGKFDDLEEMKHVAKHEFGHVLGLGDLYANSADRMTGVAKGNFAELDGYYISDGIYNLVMSDHHGMISNNDIEMVVLAFSENSMQLYQKHPRFKKELSKALGRGN